MYVHVFVHNNHFYCVWCLFFDNDITSDTVYLLSIHCEFVVSVEHHFVK